MFYNICNLILLYLNLVLLLQVLLNISFGFHFFSVSTFCQIQKDQSHAITSNSDSKTFFLCLFLKSWFKIEWPVEMDEMP